MHTPHLDRAASLRWPSFVDAALSTGVAGVFAYPLESSGARVGVLTLYQLRSGALTEQQHEDSLMVAEVLTETVLRLQADAAPGELNAHLEHVVTYRAEIYQASGMVAVQLDICAEDALVLLRAHAFAHDRPLADVAADIVVRRFVIGTDGDLQTDRGE